MNVMEEVAKYQDYAVAMRREFHRHPELSWQEEHTACRIREELKKMGIPWEEAAKTGTVGTIKGSKDGGERSSFQVRGKRRHARLRP